MMERSKESQPATKRGRSQSSDGTERRHPGDVPPRADAQAVGDPPHRTGHLPHGLRRRMGCWQRFDAAAGRSKWNRDDWNAMCAEFSRLMPEGGQS